MYRSDNLKQYGRANPGGTFPESCSTIFFSVPKKGVTPKTIELSEDYI